MRARDGAPLVVVERSVGGGPRRGRALLVHGLRGSRANFEIRARSLSARFVEAGWETVVAELRGSGRSGAAGAPPPRRVRELLELDVGALLEDAAAEGPVVLVGHSLGGLLALLAAGRSPALVQAVVALAPPAAPGAGQPVVRAAARAFARLAETRAGQAALEREAAGRLLVLGRRLLDRWPLPPRSRTVWPGSMEPEAEEELDRASGVEPAFPALLADLSRMAAGLEPEGLALADELAAVRAPVLALVGDRDEIVPPAAVLPFRDLLSGAACDVRVVGGEEGHVGHADLVLGRRAPELVWGPVLEWLAEREKIG